MAIKVTKFYKNEEKINEVVRLVLAAREHLHNHVSANPDSTVQTIPAVIWEKLTRAADLHDEVNAFLAQVRNG